MSDISGGEGAPGTTAATGLQHKPSYRHVSAGTLFKTVQEGMQRELTKGMIPEDDDDDEDDEEEVETLAERLKRIALASQAGPGKEPFPFPSFLVYRCILALPRTTRD